MNKIHVNTEVNGDDVEFLCDPRETLLDALRDRLNLTGSKEGCGTVSYTHLTLPTKA